MKFLFTTIKENKIHIQVAESNTGNVNIKKLPEKNQSSILFPPEAWKQIEPYVQTKMHFKYLKGNKMLPVISVAFKPDQKSFSRHTSGSGVEFSTADI